jgi:hypothetical protein
MVLAAVASMVTAVSSCSSLAISIVAPVVADAKEVLLEALVAPGCDMA